MTKCEDVISRQEVLKQLKGCLLGGETEYQYVKLHIDSIPSVEPQTKTGHWIEMGQNKDKTHNVICSECKVGFKFRGHANSIYTQMKYRFCSYCGADMRG